MTEQTLTADDHAFLAAHPVARMATADRDGVPHVVPVCYVVRESSLYVSIDEKPKRVSRRPLKRLRNIAENPNVAVIVDHYDDDWSKLGWVMLRGSAEVLASGREHDDAQSALAARYPQYRKMNLKNLPVIAMRIVYVSRWGNLSAEP
jgi:PPOX class probable F420-dependent enzyme